MPILLLILDSRHPSWDIHSQSKSTRRHVVMQILLLWTRYDCAVNVNMSKRWSRLFLVCRPWDDIIRTWILKLVWTENRMLSNQWASSEIPMYFRLMLSTSTTEFIQNVNKNRPVVHYNRSTLPSASKMGYHKLHFVSTYFHNVDKCPIDIVHIKVLRSIHVRKHTTSISKKARSLVTLWGKPPLVVPQRHYYPVSPFHHQDSRPKMISHYSRNKTTATLDVE